MYCWLIVVGWFVLREKYCWLVADKLSEQGAGDGGAARKDGGRRRRSAAWYWVHLKRSTLASVFLESSASVSLSSASHPKLRAFLRHVGLPELQRSDLAGPCLNLDACFDEARADTVTSLMFNCANDINYMS
jgi:hypothetical protein